MLRAVIKKELTEILTGFRFWIGCLTTLAIAGGVSWAAGEDYRLRRERWDGLTVGHAKQLRSSHTYSEAQPTVVRAPEPFSVFHPGFDSRLGVEVRIVPFRVPFEATGPSHGNEWLASAPEIGLTAVVGLVFGFFSLLLTFDSFARERESGSLRLLEFQGLTPAKLLLGKYLAALFALSLPLAAALALATERYQASFAGLFDQEARWRLAWLSLACLAYLSCSTLWGLALSVRAAGRTAALTRAIELWLVTIVIVPAVAGNSANDLLRQEQRQEKIETEARIAKLEEMRDRRIQKAVPPPRPLDGYSTVSASSHTEDRTIRRRFGGAPAYDHWSRHHAIEERIVADYARRIAVIEGRHGAVTRAGERLDRALSAASPGVLLDRLSWSIAGTSFADHERFLDACRQYHEDVQDYFDRIGASGSWRWHTDDLPEKLYPWPRFLGMSPEEVTPANAQRIVQGLGEPAVSERMLHLRQEYDADPARRIDLAGLPAFSHRPSDLPSRLRQVWPEALALLLFHLGALVYARRGLRPGAGP